MRETELTSKSMEYVAKAPLEKRKRLGQYMTPKSVYDIAVANLPVKPGDRVLDPAVGTGELLRALTIAHGGTLKLFGWDVDEEILQYASQNLEGKANLVCQNALQVEGQDGSFDAVIMNPPYFELKPSDREKREFKDVIKGRANIYAFFIKKAVELVKKDGYVACIVPPSMNNGSYFESLRKFLLGNIDISFLKVIDDSSLFVEAQTAVQVIILQKKAVRTPNRSYVVNFKTLAGSPVERSIFTEDAERVKEYWKNKISLYNLGYDVFTGPLVWNQNKEFLSASRVNKNYFPVYYSKDISSTGKLIFNTSMNEKRYMNSLAKTPLEGEAIIVNRVVGGVGSGLVKATLVQGKYYAENHVNVIKPRKDSSPKISLSALHKKLIEDTDIVNFIHLFTGNTQLSATELKYFIPISPIGKLGG